MTSPTSQYFKYFIIIQKLKTVDSSSYWPVILFIFLTSLKYRLYLKDILKSAFTFLHYFWRTGLNVKGLRTSSTAACSRSRLYQSKKSFGIFSVNVWLCSVQKQRGFIFSRKHAGLRSNLTQMGCGCAAGVRFIRSGGPKDRTPLCVKTSPNVTKKFSVIMWTRECGICVTSPHFLRKDGRTGATASWRNDEIKRDLFSKSPIEGKGEVWCVSSYLDGPPAVTLQI